MDELALKAWLAECEKVKALIGTRGLVFDQNEQLVLFEKSVRPFHFFMQEIRHAAPRLENEPSMAKKEARDVEKDEDEMHDAGPCKVCGKPTQVPFKPKYPNSTPWATCGDCYRASR